MTNRYRGLEAVDAGMPAEPQHRARVTDGPGIQLRWFSPQDAMVARSEVGLAELPTIVAVGPFDDAGHAEQLAIAFTAVRRLCEAQLVLGGTGNQRVAVVRRAVAHGVEARVHLIEDSSAHRWTDLLAAADVVVSSTTSGATLLEVLAGGRAVVVPQHPATVGLVLPTSAGLVYRPGDVSGMAEALLRLLTAPALRYGMGSRAGEVARRHHLQRTMRQQLDEGNKCA